MHDSRKIKVELGGDLIPTSKPLVIPCRIWFQSDESPYLQRSILVLFTSSGVTTQRGSGPHFTGPSSMGGSTTDAASMIVDARSSNWAKGIFGPSEAEYLVVWTEKGMFTLGVSASEWICRVSS
jgi:hypothetical protein